MAANMLDPGVITQPRPKKTVFAPSKRRKTEHKIDEINFDTTAREDYLTGFHKRKVARTKQAIAESVTKAKEERIVIRKQLREERKQELEQHVEAVNAILQDMDTDANGDNGAWNGFDDDDVEKSTAKVIDHEEEYIDEDDDRYTTVTVEAVEVDKEGLHKTVDSDNEDEDAPKPVYKVEAKDDGKKKWPKKQRKEKFRYESKVERRLGRAKIKAGNKKKADARKGD